MWGDRGWVFVDPILTTPLAYFHYDAKGEVLKDFSPNHLVVERNPQIHSFPGFTQPWSIGSLFYTSRKAVVDGILMPKMVIKIIFILI